jgi:hypothetical protein
VQAFSFDGDQKMEWATDRRSVLYRGIGLCAALFAGSGCVERLPTYRYKLTLTFEAGGKTVSGSSVVEVQPQFHNTIDGYVYQDRRKGEATLVDLGGGRIVLGLLEGNSPWEQNPTLLLQNLFGTGTRNNIDHASVQALATRREQRTLTEDQLPYLITFRDAGQPNTYEMVDPHDLAPTLGPSIKFVSASVEITDEAVTRKLTQALPWLNNQTTYLSGSTTSDQGFIRKSQLISG